MSAPQVAEREVSHQVSTIQEHMDSTLNQLRIDPMLYSWSWETLLTKLSEVESAYRKISIDLSVSCPQLLSNPGFMGRLVKCSDQSKLVLSLLHDAKVGGCCGPPKPYLGDRRLAQVCTLIEQHLQNVNKRFKLKPGGGGAALQGTSTSNNFVQQQQKQPGNQPSFRPQLPPKPGSLRN